MRLKSFLHEFSDSLYAEKPPCLVHISMKTVMQKISNVSSVYLSLLRPLNHRRLRHATPSAIKAIRPSQPPQRTFPHPLTLVTPFTLYTLNSTTASNPCTLNHHRPRIPTLLTIETCILSTITFITLSVFQRHQPLKRTLPGILTFPTPFASLLP